MRNLAYTTICLFTLLFITNCKAHKDLIHKDSQQNYKNQGEQEAYWAKIFFDKNYKKRKINRYTGDIIATNVSFQYGNSSISINKIDSNFKLIFSNGLLYPTLFDADKLNISSLEELPYLDISPKVKRIRFLVWKHNLLNPIVYFIELANKKADAQTTLSTFIEGAHLTFIRQGWIII